MLALRRASSRASSLLGRGRTFAAIGDKAPDVALDVETMLSTHVDCFETNFSSSLFVTLASLRFAAFRPLCFPTVNVVNVRFACAPFSPS